MQVIHNEDIFKAGFGLIQVRKVGTVHFCLYLGEDTGELRGKWIVVNVHLMAIQAWFTAEWVHGQRNNVG
jgi:hypothetical protein